MMNRYLQFVLLCLNFFFLSPTFSTEVIEEKPQYLDYGSEFKHPLYQVRYKVVKTPQQNDPDIYLFMCGRGMSIEMYQEWIEDFVRMEAENNPRGAVVYLMNFPGQIVLHKNQTSRQNLKGWRGTLGEMQEQFARRYRGSIKNYNEYILAAHAMVQMIYAQYQKPIGIVAHSMGGHIALRYGLHVQQAFTLDRISQPKEYELFTQKHPMAFQISRTFIVPHHFKAPTDFIKGMVLVSPMFDVNTGKFSRRFARRLAHLATFVGLGGAYVPGSSDYNHKRDSFHGDKQTSFEEGYKKIKQLRKKYGLPMVTYAWLKATFDSIRYMEKADFSGFCVPVLATLAEDEQVVLNKHTKLILGRVHSAKIKKLSGMHTPFIEKPEIRQNLLQTMIDFFEKAPVCALGDEAHH